jgi:hypothetical protein
MVTYESQPSGHWVDAQLYRSIKSQVPSILFAIDVLLPCQVESLKTKKKTMVLLHNVVISWQSSTLTILFSEMSKEELWKLKDFTIQKTIFQKSSKRNQNPSRYYITIINLEFQDKPKYHLSKILI